MSVAGLKAGAHRVIRLKSIFNAPQTLPNCIRVVNYMLKLLGLVNMSAASGQNSSADNREGDGICNHGGDGIYARARARRRAYVTDSRLEHATHGRRGL